MPADEPEKPKGEGGKDNTWFHDDVDGELDAAWREAALKIINGEAKDGDIS